MRNYELINEIYAELIVTKNVGDQAPFRYTQTVNRLAKLIEKERPELKKDNQIN
jgi:hypothetical protein